MKKKRLTQGNNSVENVDIDKTTYYAKDFPSLSDINLKSKLRNS